jgi:hypothetical protein
MRKPVTSGKARDLTVAAPSKGPNRNRLQTSMISNIKGKTVVSLNLPDGILRPYLVALSSSRPFYISSFGPPLDPTTRHPFAVFGDIPVTED